MSVYYNDIDLFCCEWMRQLIKRGLVPGGRVDCRSIADIKASDLQGFTQAHFFAGIGGWPYALRFAGWPDDVSIWTGSCPCQPFSSAGKRKGVKDERHLWPEFYQLIKECRPDVVIGEQVASADVIGAVARKAGSGRGETWLDNVFSDLEKAHYSTGAIVIPACGFGAPHRRQRLYWMAVSGVGNSIKQGLERYTGDGRRNIREEAPGSIAEASEPDRPGPTNGFWSNPDWIWCRDKKWRPAQSGIIPLVDGFPNRMGSRGDRRRIRNRLQGYGNAIVVPQAIEFIRAVKEIIL